MMTQRILALLFFFFLFGSISKAQNLSFLGIQDWPKPETSFQLSVDLSHNQIQQLSLDRPNAIVQGLDLSFNPLQAAELFDALPYFSELRSLHLNTCRLGFISERLSQLSNLTELSISDNGLRDLPIALASLKQLKRLNLSRNYLSDLSDISSEDHHFNYLDLSNNSWNKGIIPSTDTLILKGLNELNVDLPISVRYLDLSEWQAPLAPDQIRDLENLETLVLENPKNLDWVGLFDALSACSNLKTLVITDHNLLVFPNGIERFGNLQTLIIKGHRLEAFPLGIQKSKRLKEIHISQCPDLKADFVYSQLLATRKMRGILWLDKVKPELADTLNRLIKPSVFYWKNQNLAPIGTLDIPEALSKTIIGLDLKDQSGFGLGSDLMIKGRGPSISKLSHFHIPAAILDRGIPLHIDSAGFRVEIQTEALFECETNPTRPFMPYDLDVLIPGASSNFDIYFWDPFAQKWRSKGSDYLLNIKEMGTEEADSAQKSIQWKPQPQKPKALDIEGWSIRHQQKKKNTYIYLERNSNSPEKSYDLTYPEYLDPNIKHWQYIGESQEKILDILQSVEKSHDQQDLEALRLAPYSFEFDKEAGGFQLVLRTHEQVYRIPVIPVFKELEEQSDYPNQVLKWWQQYSTIRQEAERTREALVEKKLAELTEYQIALEDWQKHIEELSDWIAPGESLIQKNKETAYWHRFTVDEAGLYVLGKTIDYPHPKLAFRTINPNGTISPARRVWLLDHSNNIYGRFDANRVPVDPSANFSLVIQTLSDEWIFLRDSDFRKQSIDLINNTIWIDHQTWSKTNLTPERWTQLLGLD